MRKRSNLLHKQILVSVNALRCWNSRTDYKRDVTEETKKERKKTGELLVGQRIIVSSVLYVMLNLIKSCGHDVQIATRIEFSIQVR